MRHKCINCGIEWGGDLDSDGLYSHGLCRRWYYNGQLHVETNYKNGNLHGLYREWYADGQHWEESNYKSN